MILPSLKRKQPSWKSLPNNLHKKEFLFKRKSRNKNRNHRPKKSKKNQNLWFKLQWIQSKNSQLLQRTVPRTWLSRKTWKSQKMLQKMKMSWWNVLKDVGENSTVKHFRNTLKPVSLSLCQKERSLTHKQKDWLHKNRYAYIFISGGFSEAK